MKTVFLVFLCVAVLFVAAIHAESDEDDVSDFEVERNESMELDEALRMNMGKFVQKLNALFKRKG